MRPLLALPILAAASLPAQAEWRLENGVAVATPDESNSNIKRLVIECGAPFSLSVQAENGPVLPEKGAAGADYFYQPHRVEAEVDGHYFPLIASASDIAVVLVGQALPAPHDMTDLDPALLDLMRRGSRLTLGFDVTPESNAETDSQFETFARFSLTGSAAVIGAAMKACRPS